MPDKKEFLEGLSVLIEKYFGVVKPEDSPIVLNITKSLNEEQRLALFVVLEPQEGEYTSDLHSDTYTDKEIEKACHNYNQHCMKANLFHKIETQDAEIVESYITPVDMNIDGRIIKSGTWLQKWYFPETEIGDLIWESVKSKEITGVSIQARATVEDLNE